MSFPYLRPPDTVFWYRGDIPQRNVLHGAVGHKPYFFCVKRVMHSVKHVSLRVKRGLRDLINVKL